VVLGMKFSDSVLAFCNLPLTTNLICPNCVKKWKSMLKKTNRDVFGMFIEGACQQIPFACQYSSSLKQIVSNDNTILKQKIKSSVMLNFP
jgi:hypothetical protein